jgi:hypothetical protein
MNEGGLNHLMLKKRGNPLENTFIVFGFFDLEG